MLKFSWMGDVFLNALKGIIVPLVFTSVVSSVASLGDIRKLGKLGGITVAYYFITTSLAVIIGLVAVNIIKPGANLHFNDVSTVETIINKNEIATLSDILISMVSPNLIASAANTQVLPIILFSVLFGAALATLGKQCKTVNEFFTGANSAMLKTGWVDYVPRSTGHLLPYLHTYCKCRWW